MAFFFHLLMFLSSDISFLKVEFSLILLYIGVYFYAKDLMCVPFKCFSRMRFFFQSGVSANADHESTVSFEAMSK